MEITDKSNNWFLWVYLRTTYNEIKLVIIIKEYLKKIFLGWFPNSVWKSKKPLAVEVDPTWSGVIINFIKSKSNLYEKWIKAKIVIKITKKIWKKFFLYNE